MATTQSLTDIYNVALGLCGEDGQLSSPTEASNAADALNLFWPQARRFCLSLYNWDFARKRVSLTKDIAAPAFEYGSQFLLPADFIRLAYEAGRLPNYSSLPDDEIYAIIPAVLHDGMNAINADDVQIENGYLLTHTDTCNILYIYDCMDVSRYTPQFIELAQLKLAALACFRLTGSASRQGEIEQKFKNATEESMTTTAAQSKVMVIRGAFANTQQFKV